MGMFAKRIQPKNQKRQNFRAEAVKGYSRQIAKTDRARANRKRLNAAKKANRGNQMRGGQNRRKEQVKS